VRSHDSTKEGRGTIAGGGVCPPLTEGKKGRKRHKSTKGIKSHVIASEAKQYRIPALTPSETLRARAFVLYFHAFYLNLRTAMAQAFNMDNFAQAQRAWG
jgi:hypothetical protein